jgi:RNA polymerase sigma factor (sigma-70 family)
MDSARWYPGLADEELVALAKKADGQGALDVLILRYLNVLEQWVARRCERRRLGPEDRWDAQQQVLIGFCQAVRTFDPERIRAGQEQPFRVYYFQVIQGRFTNYARSVDRHRKRSGQSLDSMPLRDSQRYQFPGLLGSAKPSSRCGRDPALIAEENEEEERLAAAVQKLPERQQRISELLLNGASLQTVAETFGVSYSTAWNWQQQIIETLREAVRDKSETE